MQRTLAILALLLTTPLTGGAALAQPAPRAARNVVVNRVRLPDEQMVRLEQLYRMRIADGGYWYDRRSGAWGLAGGPTAGFLLPNLNLGGPLRADASGGHTGVFVNGRQLHVLDVAALAQLVPVVPGRYWVDAFGNCGREGGPALVNLVALAQAAQARGRKAGGAWSHSSSTLDSHVGGDGETFYYIISTRTPATSTDRAGGRESSERFQVGHERPAFLAVELTGVAHHAVRAREELK
jgi:hypothetical protein